MKSNTGSQIPPTGLVIGAIIMVALPLLLGIGLISWLIMNRNSQPEALPTLVSTQALLSTAVEIAAQTPSVPAAAETATPAQNVSPLTPSTPATASTENPAGTTMAQITATAEPTSAGGNLATATRTSLPPTANSGGTLSPSATQTNNNTSTATATSTPTPTPTVTPIGVGIIVKNMRWYFDAELNLTRVVGEVTNNTDTQQLIETLEGVFYSAPGVTVNPNDIIEFSPQEVIPVGGTVPFYFELDAVTSLDNYTVTVQTDFSPFVTRTDLILQDQSERIDADGLRCFEGKVRNAGERLQNEIVITASLYDDQNNFVNFNYEAFDSGVAFTVLGDRTRSYSVCVRPPHNGRVDVRVYGR